MKRRNFLINGWALSAGTLLGAQMVQGMIIHPDADNLSEKYNCRDKKKGLICISTN